MVDGGAPQYLYIVIPLVVVAFFVWMRPCISGQHTRGDDAYTALLSPTVRRARNAFDRRVALAVREANLGFVECRGCGFTNALRAKSCVLCGISTERNKPRGTAARLFGHRATAAPAMSSQQQSIRRRKAWRRDVSPDNALVWRFDAQLRGLKQPDLPHFVVQITRQEAEDELEPTLEEIVVLAQPDAEAAPTLEQIAARLKNELRRFHVAAEAVVDGDVALMPTDLRPTAPERLSSHDSVVLAELDFPSKLAHFITSMAALFDEAAARDESSDQRPVARFTVARASLVADSIAALSTLSATQARGPVRVEFANDIGIDAGGVYREWFLLLNAAIVQPAAGIFVCVDHRNQTFYLNPHAQETLGEDYLTHFLAGGRLLGRALLDGNVTGFHLALPLIKLILGLPWSFCDLKYFDPELYKQLKWLLDHDGVDALALDFTVDVALPSGVIRSVELIQGGTSIDVTDENKRDFVDRKLKYALFESVEMQLLAFLKGIYEVVPPELIVLFDAQELDYMFSGSDEVDVDDWHAHTVVATSNLLNHPAMDCFWAVVRELSSSERRKLLQFSTGSRRVPPGGFAALTSNDGQLCLFSLKGVPAEATRGYLHSHACFNAIDLPLHGFLKDMRIAVRAAIDNEILGFTTH